MAVIISLFGLLPVQKLHATDPFQLNTAQLVATADLIIAADLVPDGDKIEARAVEVLKGEVPKDFRILAKAVFPREIKEGDEIGAYHSDDDDNNQTILLDKDPAANRRIVFLLQNRSYNLECVQPESKMPQVRESLAMLEDPAPFVKSGKHDGNVDLIFLLGIGFRAFHVEGVNDWLNDYLPPLSEEEELKEALVRRLLPDYDVPWDRVRLTIPLNYDATRQPPLTTDLFDAQGPVPNFIRKRESSRFYRDDPYGKGGKLPAHFTVTLDTRGPDNVGTLTREEASRFLVKQLRLDNEDAALAAHKALISMRDCDAVTAAIGMMREENAELRSRAIKLLLNSRDPAAVEKLGAVMDTLPQIHNGGHDMENPLARTLTGALPEGPGKLAALRKAMKKGYVGIQIASSVAETGDAEDFVLLLSHFRDPAAVPHTKPLATMVKRSNQKVEEWMEDIGTGESQGQDPLRQRWIAWWEAHKAGFRIVRTGDDALKTN